MGNQPSLDGHGVASAARPVRNFMRSTGVLGLSRSELDERCKPSGLYPSCQWEEKAIRRLIGDGKIAARLKGTECRTSPADRECPICFLHYTEVNLTKCCQAHICTECYLQVRPQKEKSPHCPFCNHSRVTVTVARAMDVHSIMKREEEEQRVIEAKIRAQSDAQQANAEENAIEPGNQESVPTACSSSSGATSDASPAPQQQSDTTNSFGSSLEKHERVACLRARTSSSMSDSAEQIPDKEVLQSFAMTPEERRALEDEMRAQHSHPLSLRLEAEAEERRAQNEREYYRTHGSRLLEMRARTINAARRGRMQHARMTSDTAISSESSGQRRRDWNQIVDAFERGGNGEVNSLDDLVVLEAAMILSMEEEARRRGDGSTRNEAGASGNEASTFDASRHANEGFPLLRSLLAGRTATGQEGADGEADNTNASNNANEELNDQVQPLARNLYSRRRGGRNTLLRAYRNASMNTAVDTATMLMRGISEEDQVAMAIAASLQDQQQPTTSENEDGSEELSNNGANNTSSSERQGVQESEEPRNDEMEEHAQSEAEAASDGASSTASDYESTSEERLEVLGLCTNSNNTQSPDSGQVVAGLGPASQAESSNDLANREENFGENITE